MRLEFGKGDWQNFADGVSREWLVTNGLGGYASGTLIGANTRKYHGLLVASLTPPVRRTVLLAKLDERFQAGGRVYNLAVNQAAGGVTDAGFIHLQRAVFEPLPVFTYSFGDIFMEKTVGMVYGKNTTVITYRVQNGAEPAALLLRPLVNCRDFHRTAGEGEVQFSQQPGEKGTIITTVPEVPDLRIICSHGEYQPGGQWYRGMFYSEEERRGLHPWEDHYMPGEFVIPLAPLAAIVVTVAATAEPEAPAPDGPALLAAEERRLQETAAGVGLDDGFARSLALSADAFIVNRQSTGAKTVIAGYPWFNDWGRDTMIALPGLTLVTGRYADAAQILSTFARYAEKGLLPNVFPDAGGAPAYNTVDASLWFFHAVYKYLQYTGDFDFVRERIYPVLREILDRHVEGAGFNIRLDPEDGLIMAGSPDIQLTWMDAKVGDWVVTPRHGKPVEVNALWYNALRVMELLARAFGGQAARPGLADRAGASFRRVFHHRAGGYLYDVVSPAGSDARFRPNQVIAAALPFSPVPEQTARRLVRRAWRDLYATYGLRSLEPGHWEYRGRYGGDQVQRDGAYHQGTAWSWLMGPFVTAYRKAHGYSPASREQAGRFLAPFRDHLRQHGVGHISEIFDADEPVTPRGCFAQAWGTAEVLRAYVEEYLEVRPPGRGI
ncbi:MAG: amylo-alpha-1,6-glucosidase [Firmicutes bacterium]|nr:amylo-alpha-1,6-glucosidase [Bacillota bacterium]